MFCQGNYRTRCLGDLCFYSLFNKAVSGKQRDSEKTSCHFNLISRPQLAKRPNFEIWSVIILHNCPRSAMNNHVPISGTPVCKRQTLAHVSITERVLAKKRTRFNLKPPWKLTARIWQLAFLDKRNFYLCLPSAPLVCRTYINSTRKYCKLYYTKYFKALLYKGTLLGFKILWNRVELSYLEEERVCQILKRTARHSYSTTSGNGAKCSRG